MSLTCRREPTTSALGAFDTTFGATDFDVTSSSTDAGPISRNFNGVDADLNNDTLVNGLDIDMLQDNLVNGPPKPGVYDLTGDGSVTAGRSRLVAGHGRALSNLPSGSPYLLGDANLNGVVDGSDFGVWNTNKFQSADAFSMNWEGDDEESQEERLHALDRVFAMR